MKLRLLISLLFIIAITTTAIHELTHIGHDHDNSTCQVCIVDKHSISADIIDDFTQVKIIKFSEINPTLLVKLTHIKNHSCQTRAPPYNS